MSKCAKKLKNKCLFSKIRGRFKKTSEYLNTSALFTWTPSFPLNKDIKNKDLYQDTTYNWAQKSIF